MKRIRVFEHEAFDRPPSLSSASELWLVVVVGLGRVPGALRGPKCPVVVPEPKQSVATRRRENMPRNLPEGSQVCTFPSSINPHLQASHHLACAGPALFEDYKRLAGARVHAEICWNGFLWLLQVFLSHFVFAGVRRSRARSASSRADPIPLETDGHGIAASSATARPT